MRDFVRKAALAVLFIMTVFSTFAAGETVFKTETPLMVSVGEAFRVEFHLNAKPDEGTFKAPSFEGFDVVAGPSTSTGSSWSMINGKTTTEVSYSITYVLLAQNAGNNTIGEASIQVDGKTYRTKATPVEIVKEGQDNASKSDQGQAQSSRPNQQTAQGQIAKDDILLRTIVSRNSVYKGEPLKVTFKLYVRVNVVGFEDIKFPSFNGFWAQELDINNLSVQRETYKGKVYETQVVREFLLYPQQTGTLNIDPVSLTAIAQVVVQNDNYDPFFGPSHDFYNVPRKIQSQKLNIQVKNLPQGAPSSFNGAVGHFTMKSTEPGKRFEANSAATYTVKISGTGNLTFIQAPKLTLPSSFELYNVKTTESINTTQQGITGYRQFEYPFIARAEGTYDLPPIEFSYFDPQKEKYQTLSTKALQIEVTPDTRTSSSTANVNPLLASSKEDVQLLSKDIRFIKVGKANLKKDQEPLLFSKLYWVILGAILLIFEVIYLFLLKRIRDAQNVAFTRGRRANKVAIQRFRAAKRHMEAQNRHAFYEEMLRALWGYMSDKFNIPVSNLTKENVREELHKRGISEEESQRFSKIVSQCDEAQYSPVESAPMSEVYAEGVDFISQIESSIKR